jgi:hypothetical protein
MSIPIPTPTPTLSLDPTSCFQITEIFSGGVDITCLVIILVAILLIVVALAVSIYLLVMVLIKGTPKRVAQRKELALQEANVEAISIAVQMGADPTRPYLFVPDRDRRNPYRILGILGVFMLGFSVVSAQIEISNIRAQIPCAATRLSCTGRQEQAIRADVSFNVPIQHTATREVEKWMVVPFTSLDFSPGIQYCDPIHTGFDQCFLINNGSGIDISVEVGPLRLAYLMDPVPDYIFPADYALITTENTGHNCSVPPPVNFSDVYYGETGCIAADCICGAGNYSQIMYPLLPQCGIYSFRKVWPFLATWIRVNITSDGHLHTATMPLAKFGQLIHSPGFGVELEVVGFEEISNGRFDLPRLDGGIVICDSTLNFAGPDRAQEPPGIPSIEEDWYYVNCQQRLDQYQNGICGHNGVSAVEIYSSTEFCCTPDTNFSTGYCIPDPTPQDILLNLTNTSTYQPPLPGGTVENAYWPYVDAQSELYLLREVQEFELPNGIQPRLTLRATIRDTIASINTRRLLPGLDLRYPRCEYYHPDGIGVLRAHLCNSAMHKAVVPFDAIEMRIQCDGEDGIVARFFSELLTVRRIFNTARCVEVYFHYNFTHIPFQFNTTDPRSYLVDLFEMRCTVNATLQLENQVVPVLMHVLEDLRCHAVIRNSTQPTFFVGNATDIKNARPPPCKSESEIMCHIHQGTLGATWFGPFFLGMSITLFIFVLTFFPLYTAKLESENHARAEKHQRVSIDKLDPRIVDLVQKQKVL